MMENPINIIQTVYHSVIDDRDHIKTMVLIFSTCLLVYILFWSGHHYSIDGVVMFEYAKALLFQHSFTMNPPLVWGDEFQVSIWPIGQTLLYIPILAILSASIFRYQTGFQKIPYQPGQPYLPALMENLPYRYASFTNLIITAATAALVYIFCIQTGMPKKRAGITALVFGIASPAAVYAKLDFAQPLASFLILAALIFAFRSREKHFYNLILASIFLGFAVLTRPETVLYAVPAIILVAFFIPSDDSGKWVTHGLYRMLSVLIIVLGFVALNQVINAVRFGSYFSVGYNPAGGNRFIFDAAYTSKAVIGNLVSPGRGLLLFFPLSLLSLIGLWYLWKQSRFIAIILGSIPITALIVYSSWSQWAGGISWGPRFLVPILPYVTILPFWSYNSMAHRPKVLKVSLFILLILAGWAISLQGQYFNFLDFYNSRTLSDAVIMQGDYNFKWDNSPIVGGWKGGLNTNNADGYWFRSISNNPLRSWLVIIGTLFLIGFLSLYWKTFFFSTVNHSTVGLASD